MTTIVRLALRPEEDAKVTPREVLRDFSDATPGWSFLEEDSRHYAEVKSAEGLVIRHRVEPAAYVDLAFTGSRTDENTLELAVLDPPASDVELTGNERRKLMETFLDEMRTYLRSRPDHVTLEVENQQAGRTPSQ